MLPRAIVTTCVVALAALSWSCDELPDLPTSPSPLVEGIVIYEHADFLGNAGYITSDIDDLRDFKGPCIHEGDDGVTRDWNDCVSSVRIAPGWHATIYKDTDYHDDSLQVTGDVPNLERVAGDCDPGLNDCISSVRVSRD